MMLAVGVALVVIPLALLVVYYMAEPGESWEAVKAAVKVNLILLPGYLAVAVGIALILKWASK